MMREVQNLVRFGEPWTEGLWRAVAFAYDHPELFDQPDYWSCIARHDFRPAFETVTGWAGEAWEDLEPKEGWEFVLLALGDSPEIFHLCNSGCQAWEAEEGFRDLVLGQATVSCADLARHSAPQWLWRTRHHVRELHSGVLRCDGDNGFFLWLVVGTLALVAPLADADYCRRILQGRTRLYLLSGFEESFFYVATVTPEGLRYEMPSAPETFAWSSCEEPASMLRFLHGKVSERKLRLLACAFCRGIWPLLAYDRSRQAVETCERYADGLASAEELEAAAIQARAAGEAASWVTWTCEDRARAAAQGESATGKMVDRVIAAADQAEQTAARAAAKARPVGVGQAEQAWYTASAEQRRFQCHWVRDLCGNLFRSVVFQPSWLAWNSGLVGKIAHVIYAERRFQDLPILADALEDAGCTDAEILAHCRQPAPHALGCWVVDQVLGKE
jgi:hypothetical protein